VGGPVVSLVSPKGAVRIFMAGRLTLSRS